MSGSAKGDLFGLLTDPQAWSIAAIVLGLAVCVWGMIAYRRLAQITSIGTSRIATAAAGEVRVSGTVVPVGSLLMAPHSQAPCVYYHWVVTSEGPAHGIAEDRRYVVVDETKSTPFAIDDGSGRVTVFTRDVRWDVPEDFVHAGWLPEAPKMTPAQLDAARSSLLSVQQPVPTFEPSIAEQPGSHSVEVRIDPGDTVTAIGSLLPYGDLGDAFAEPDALDDPVIAADLAAARAAGDLAASPEEAAGNAAIPGFGIGKPERPPVLDPEATPEPAVPRAPGASRAGGLDLAPEALVLAAGPQHPLAIFAGTPAEAARRADTQFLLGVIGGAVAMVGAVLLALELTGYIG